jgi:hypothetical protein
MVGTTRQKRSLLNSGAILFVPQGNPERRTGDIYTLASTVPSAWVTARRLKEREEISRVSPMKSYFSDKWVSPLNDGYQRSQDQTLDIDLQASPMSLTNTISIVHGIVSMSSQYFYTTNHKKSQYDFAFKADLVLKL